MTSAGGAHGAAEGEPERDRALRELESAFGEIAARFRVAIAALAEATSPGMLPATFKVLTTIERCGPIGVTALAEQLLMDKAQTSRNVSELEQLGLVGRGIDPADRRIRKVEITPLARERLQSARDQGLALHAGVREWPIEAIVQLRELLQALARGEVPGR